MKPDKQYVRKSFGRKLPQYHQMAQVQQGIAAELATLYNLHFDVNAIKRVYEAGAGTGFLTRYLRYYHPKAEFYINDLTEASAPYLEELLADYNAHFLWGDAEEMDLPQELDAVLSSSTIQWFGDVGGFLDKSADAMNSGGALALSSFGPDNFREIRTIGGDGLDYMTRNELGELATSKGYEILHLTEQSRTLYFDIPLDVLYHVKYTGVNSLMPKHWTRSSLKDFTERYRRLFMTRDGLVPLTYHPVFLIARKK